MNLTGDQRYFLTILGQTGFVRPDQVLPLLRINEPGKESGHAEAMLRRLRYLGLLSRSSEGLICLPELRNSAPDRERLFALDILMALTPAKLLQVSVQPPYKLCFLLERADGWTTLPSCRCPWDMRCGSASSSRRNPGALCSCCPWSGWNSTGRSRWPAATILCWSRENA